MAACLADKLADGLSAVYSFFAPGMEKRSLGTFAVLWLIERARSLGLPYVYLGYWVPESRKMAYKARFKPSEVLMNGSWRVLTEREIAGGRDNLHSLEPIGAGLRNPDSHLVPGGNILHGKAVAKREMARLLRQGDRGKSKQEHRQQGLPKHKRFPFVMLRLSNRKRRTGVWEGRRQVKPRRGTRIEGILFYAGRIIF